MKRIATLALLVVQAILWAPPSGAQPTTRSTFDAYGNLASLESPLGGVRSYDHNHQGQQSTVRLNGQILVRDAVFGSHGRVEQYVYDGLGMGPARLAEHAYDPLGRPTLLSLEAVGQAGGPDYLADTFGWDERGFVTGYRRSDRSVGEVTVTLGYTSQGQLGRFDWGGQALVYVYDGSGNLESRSGGLGVAPLAASYDAWNHRGGWLYDLRGRLVEDDRFAYEYDALDRIRLVRERESGSWVAHYLYDSAGHRARALEPDTVTYAYRDVTGGVIAEEVHGSDHAILEQREQVTLGGRQVHTATLHAEGTVEHQQQFTDRLGNPVFSWEGGKETVHEYSPFGQALDVGAAQPHEGAYGFTGHEDDASTGLTYMRARYYDPAAARFNRPDPARDFDVHLPATVNLYQYARGNPEAFVDPTGEAVSLLIRDNSGDSLVYHAALRIRGTTPSGQSYDYVVDFHPSKNGKPNTEPGLLRIFENGSDFLQAQKSLGKTLQFDLQLRQLGENQGISGVPDGLGAPLGPEQQATFDQLLIQSIEGGAEGLTVRPNPNPSGTPGAREYLTDQPYKLLSTNCLTMCGILLEPLADGSVQIDGLSVLLNTIDPKQAQIQLERQGIQGRQPPP